MDVIQTSTDTLYKFITTSGIALTVVCVLSWFQGVEKLRTTTFDAETKAGNGAVEFERWEGEAKLVGQHMDSQNARAQMFLSRFADALKNAQAIPKPERDQIASDIQGLFEIGKLWGWNEIKVIVEDFYKRINEEVPARDRQFFIDLERENQEIAEKNQHHLDLGESVDKQRQAVDIADRQVADLKDTYWWVSWSCFIGIIAGAVTTCFGLFMWWWRFQSIEDQIHKLRLKELEKANHASQQKSNKP